MTRVEDENGAQTRVTITNQIHFVTLGDTQQQNGGIDDNFLISLFVFKLREDERCDLALFCFPAIST